MRGWNQGGYSHKASENSKASGFSPRPQAATREMVSGLVSHALALAIRDFAKSRGQSVTKTVDEMGLGASTWKRLTTPLPIAQTTVLKIVTYMGTDVRSVLTKYQRKETE